MDQDVNYERLLDLINLKSNEGNRKEVVAAGVPS
jgi:hypothetical protein